MGWSESEVVCMKHQNHKQSPGVCSCCLREKLSNLSVPINLVPPSFNQYYSSPSNSSTPTKFYYYSSGHSSSTHTPPSGSQRRGKHHRITSDVLSSFSLASGSSGLDGLKKSRSIAFVAGRGRRFGGAVKGGVDNGDIKEKKEGFWSKLMKSTSKRTKYGFVHPRMKESFVN